MLALSPPLFPSNYRWPLEDLITTQNLPLDCNEANSYNNSNNNTLLIDDLHTYDQIFKQDFEPEKSISSGGTANGSTGDDTMVAKKLNHNASERDRRKRVNDLYAFLRSLLPMSSDQKKKVSIPGTVSRAVKYIPELQKEVEKLRCKKEKLLSYSSSTADLGIKKQRADHQDTIIKTKSSVVSSVSSLGDKEAVIQLMSNKKEISILSEVLEYIEQDEDELVLLNATTFRCMGEEMLLSTLHLQIQGDHEIQAEKLKEKLCAFLQ